MKKAALFATILALALGVSAQTVNFGVLPTALSPTALPNGYANLDWSGFYYVAPSWSGAGAGFQQGPSTLNVAYMGGRICELTEALCSGSISSHAAADVLASFHARSAIVAAGYHAETLSVTVYNQGQFVGSHAYNLTTALQEIDFPVSWGAITQLVMETTKGTVVLYALDIQSVSASAISVGPNALNGSVGPTVPIHIVDPMKDAPASGNGGPSGPPVQNIGPAVSLPILDPPPPGRLTSAGSLSPPIQYNGPNAKGGPIEPRLPPPSAVDNAGSSIQYNGPNASGGLIEPRLPPPSAVDNAKSSIQYNGPTANGGPIEPPLPPPSAVDNAGSSQ